MRWKMMKEDPGVSNDVTRVYFSPLVGYPKWKVRCRVAAISLSEDAKVECRSNRTPTDTRRW